MFGARGVVARLRPDCGKLRALGALRLPYKGDIPNLGCLWQNARMTRVTQQKPRCCIHAPQHARGCH